MNVFLLSLPGQQIYFTGPSMSEDAFKEYCCSLLDDCGTLALEEAKKHPEDLIAPLSVVGFLPRLLERNGFTRIEIKFAGIPLCESFPQKVFKNSSERITTWNGELHKKLQASLHEQETHRRAKELRKKPAEMRRLQQILRMAEK